MATSALFTIFSPEVRADPYPLYKQLREADPVLETGFGAWLVMRYADAVEILRDHDHFSVDHANTRTEVATPLIESVGPSERGLQNVMLFMDPPDHTRLRSLVNKAFTPRSIERLRQRVHEVVDELLEPLDGTFDVIERFAYPLPVTVIAGLLGIPASDHAQFRRWARDVAPILDPILPLETANKVGEAGMMLAGYFFELIEQRRKDPRDDLLTALIQAEEEGDRLTPDELRATCILLLIAGHETTMNLIGNGLHALLRNPGQIERLREHPELMRSAVEEFLRYDGPVHLTARSALSDVEVGGKTIPKGGMAMVLLGAANRDPEVFARPDALDVGRAENHHLAFSAGGHFCLGATLARLEAQIAFAELLKRFEKIELADEPTYRDTITLRGLSSLEVTVG
jgi:cytochrome P450